MLAIWFHVKIDNIPACQVVLVYPVAKFEEMHMHWGLTLYTREIGNARGAIQNVLKLQHSL